MNKVYTGVGSTKTPDDILAKMTGLASALDRLGYTLRSGHAKGADQAFECVSTRKEIYLPHAGFEGASGAYYYPLKDMAKSKQAYELASIIHPNWEACNAFARRAHARDCFQVLGPNLDDPSDFLVAWAPVRPNGEPEGGTRTAIVLARRHSVPVFNLSQPGQWKAVNAFLETLQRGKPTVESNKPIWVFDHLGSTPRDSVKTAIAIFGSNTLEFLPRNPSRQDEPNLSGFIGYLNLEAKGTKLQFSAVVEDDKVVIADTPLFPKAAEKWNVLQGLKVLIPPILEHYGDNIHLDVPEEFLLETEQV